MRMGAETERMRSANHNDHVAVENCALNIILVIIVECCENGLCCHS